MWFFAEARKEYERRIADPRIQSVLRFAIPPLRRATELLQEVRKISDPVNPKEPALGRGVER
jgi:hypothetical protein